MATELPSLVILPHEMSRKFPLQLRCLVRVNRVGLTMRRSHPVFTYEQTPVASVGMSQRCQTRTLVSGDAIMTVAFRTQVS